MLAHTAVLKQSPMSPVVVTVHGTDATPVSAPASPAPVKPV